MNNKTLVQIPFEGFYNSVTEHLIGGEIEQYIEYKQETNPEYDDYPDYSVDFQLIARGYVRLYRQWLVDNDFPDIALEFESLSSPKEYNFTTDRIFCHVDLDQLLPYYNLFMSSPDAQEKIDNRFKSRSGFASFYNDFCEDWKTKPIDKWDFNELMILFPEPDYWELWEYANSNGLFFECITFKDDAND